MVDMIVASNPEHFNALGTLQQAREFFEPKGGDSLIDNVFMPVLRRCNVEMKRLDGSISEFECGWYKITEQKHHAAPKGFTRVLDEKSLDTDHSENDGDDDEYCNPASYELSPANRNLETNSPDRCEAVEVTQQATTARLYRLRKQTVDRRGTDADPDPDSPPSPPSPPSPETPPSPPDTPPTPAADVEDAHFELGKHPARPRDTDPDPDPEPEPDSPVPDTPPSSPDSPDRNSPPPDIAT